MKKFILSFIITSMMFGGYFSENFIRYSTAYGPKNRTVDAISIFVRQSSYINDNIKIPNKINLGKGNKYIIRASLGEIDYQNPNEIFLTDVVGIINLVDKNNIMIKSDFGKYNIENNDTIFSKNVKIENSKDKIYGDYLDFSIVRSLMLLSKNVTYSNLSRQGITKGYSTWIKYLF